ncbi:MAG: efflux RND transporter periplasmic adaptor subunit [bacterium]|nr:efflux RND transporter periplasmic adaptor subunit [bacterium]
MRNKIVIILAVMLTLIFGRMLYSHINKANADKKRNTTPAVTVDIVQSENVRRQFETTARVVAKYRVDVLARIDGYLTKSYFKEGDFVKAGQVLFEIEPQEYIYATDRAKANMDNIQSQADYYNKQLARYAELVKQDYIAKSEYDNILAQKNAYSAQVESARSAYNDAKRNLGYTKVKAPVDGRIGIINVTVGNYVTTAIGPLTTINSSNPMYVTFPIESKDYAELTNIDKSENVNREVEFIFSSGEKYLSRGIQDFHDNKIDENTGTITLRATFDNPQDRLIQGDFGKAIIYSNNKEALPIVPQSATMENQEGLFIYVLDEKNLPRISYIKTMGTSGTNWIVSDGVNIGDRIVTTGVQKVIPGSQIRIVKSVQTENTSEKKEGLLVKLFRKIKNMIINREK